MSDVDDKNIGLSKYLRRTIFAKFLASARTGIKIT